MVADTLYFRGRLATVVFLTILFFISSLTKWLFPSRLPFHLDQIAIGIEICMGVLLLFYYRQPWIWAVLSVLFSLWLGYSFFWFIRNENCSCFGKALPISAGIMASMDAIIIGVSFWHWKRLKNNSRNPQILGHSRDLLSCGAINIFSFIIGLCLALMVSRVLL